MRSLMRRCRNWWRYGAWTPCQHRWMLHEMCAHDGITRTADLYWTCPDCGGYISFVHETGA